MSIRKLVSVTLSVALLAFACSKQGEGERCSLSNVSQDCEDGLICQSPQSKANECNDVDPAHSVPNCLPSRCCYAAPQAPTDNRCIGYQIPVPATGTGGAGGGTNDVTGGNTSAGGATSTGGSASNGGTSATTGGTSATTGGAATSAGGSAATGGTRAATTT